LCTAYTAVNCLALNILFRYPESTPTAPLPTRPDSLNDGSNWTLVFISGCIGLFGGLTAMIIDAIQGDPFNVVALGTIAAGAILATVALAQRKKTPAP